MNDKEQIEWHRINARPRDFLSLEWAKDVAYLLAGWKAEAERLGAEVAELNGLFNLQQTRMHDATEKWRQATGKHDVLPDLGDLLAWLLAERDALRERVRELEPHEIEDAENEVIQIAREAAKAAKTAAARAITEWATKDTMGMQQRTLAEVVMTAIDAALAPAPDHSEEGREEVPGMEELREFAEAHPDLFGGKRRATGEPAKEGKP